MPANTQKYDHTFPSIEESGSFLACCHATLKLYNSYVSARNENSIAENQNLIELDTDFDAFWEKFSTATLALSKKNAHSINDVLGKARLWALVAPDNESANTLDEILMSSIIRDLEALADQS